MRKSRTPENYAAARVQAFLQAAVLHSLFCAICNAFLSPFARMRNLFWTRCFKQTAFSTHVGRRLKISSSPVDILLPPFSVLDKRHKLFLTNKAGFVALEPHPPAQGLLISGEAIPQTQYSFCILWRKLIAADDGEGTSLNMGLLFSSKSCEPVDTSALLIALWVSEAVKQNKRKRHFAKVAVSENKVP